MRLKTEDQGSEIDGLNALLIDKQITSDDETNDKEKKKLSREIKQLSIIKNDARLDNLYPQAATKDEGNSVEIVKSMRTGYYYEESKKAERWL